MGTGKIKMVAVSLMPEEVKFITECMLNCPFTADVKSMPHILSMAQGIIKKMTVSTPSPSSTTGE